ncbi:type II toxin-antitoxin system Phd/YefM family antitoxin [Enterococcus sp. HY326]|uniref:type II toxin-antitoxin system Phd/YefM family antitoxin n=1 Tax=Enterococcus sp. HY326 TaxID=2971265 RepID=UPI00223E928F|nr:type II toxin-antitoxin system Phd/YefM family antitoxin [Enterococcus sp. HY326]
MELKKLEVPTSSITEVKRSPMEVFEQARKEGTGVYIFNREKVAGVMVTKDQYEKLVEELEALKAEKTTISKQQLLEKLQEAVKDSLVKETKIGFENMDNILVGYGFVSRRDVDQSLTEMIQELSETGKIIYRSWKWPNLTLEIVGELDPEAQQIEKIIIKKLYFLGVE